MPTTATPTTNANVTVNKVKVTVLHARPTGFRPTDGKKIKAGDELYDPNTGVHTVTDLVTPTYAAPARATAGQFRRARATGWQNTIFNDHKYLVRPARPSTEGN